MFGYNNQYYIDPKSIEIDQLKTNYKNHNNLNKLIDYVYSLNDLIKNGEWLDPLTIQIAEFIILEQINPNNSKNNHIIYTAKKIVNMCKEYESKNKSENKVNSKATYTIFSNINYSNNNNNYNNLPTNTASQSWYTSFW